MKFNHLREAAWYSFFGLSCFILSLIIVMCVIYPDMANSAYKLFSYIGDKGIGVFNDSSTTYYNGRSWNFGEEFRLFCFMILGFWIIFTLIINRNLNSIDEEREREIEEREFRERVKEFMDNK